MFEHLNGFFSGGKDLLGKVFPGVMEVSINTVTVPAALRKAGFFFNMKG